jgi:propionaldehyde dehydrogenase
MTHPDVQMIVSTGGIDVLRRAMSAGKKVIGAGPANPVVIADETADINKAAKDIIEGASFDNNVMCVTEKSVVAVDSIADTLERAMERNGALILNRLQDVIALRNAAVTEDRLPSKMLEGRSASEILDAAGLPRTGSPKVILAETEPDDPLVTLELPMPVLPLVRARNFDEALELALEIEQGFRHTAILHSKSIERLSRAAKALQTALFVKNGSSLAGIGMNGGPASFTIATATGEGTTTARHFTRRRRCVLSESFSIR